VGSKARGIQTKVLIAGYDLSNAFKSFANDNSVESFDATAFMDTAKSYVVGFPDGKFSLEGFYDSVPSPGTADAIDDILRPLLGSSVRKAISVSPENDAFGKHCFLAQGFFTNLKVTNPAQELIMESVDFQADEGVAAGLILHALAEETSDADGLSIDNGASGSPSENGGRGQLQVTALAGTSTPALAAKIQDSDDNSTFVDLIIFTPKTAIGAEQIDVTGTVERYVRTTWALTGTGPAFTFQVAFARY